MPDVRAACDQSHAKGHQFCDAVELAGIDKYEAVKEQEADIKATGRLAKLHDEILRQNPEWTTDEKRHALNQFMTRILFCMFAEDTGSFAKDLFVKTITEFGGGDGQHLQPLFKQIFDVMNVPDDQRDDVPAHIRAFPYVNGGLFADHTEVPVFNKRAKRILIEAAQLDWSQINPDIFGSMIQAIVHPDMRGDLGLHYTSVPNIMKVLQPLFLISLEEEFAQAQGHREERSRLNKLLTRISKIRVFDPACGSGNFLIIAYRELRTIEMRIFKRIEELDGGQRSRHWTGVKLSNFYGIELADFAAETAKLSLWIAEYQMNQRFKDLFGEAPPNFPLADGGHIVCDNALRRDWLEICPPPMKVVQKQKVLDIATVVPISVTEERLDEEVETYIVSTPPYLGSTRQADEQKQDIANLFASRITSYKDLDYVACWFIKAADYCVGKHACFGFVATNSICQGEQVAMLWPLILDGDLEIAFAYKTFKWLNSAANNAGVMCIIVGVRNKSSTPKKLFRDGLSIRARNIGPYLVDMDNLYVTKRTAALSSIPRMVYGNSPTDGGNLLLSDVEKRELITNYPEAEPLIRRLYGSQEFYNGIIRWCLWIDEGTLALAQSIVPIAARIRETTKTRLASKNAGAQQCAQQGYRFRFIGGHSQEAVIVPKSTTVRREYIVSGFIDERTIVTDLMFAIYGAEPYLMALISSKLHYIWGAAVGGRLKEDPRYSNTLVYNTFPLPALSADNKTVLDGHAWDILAAREAHQGKTLAWLYDPDTMPKNLLDAHRALDDTLEKIYIGRPFKNDTERLEYLFKLYAEMTAGKKKEAASA